MKNSKLRHSVQLALTYIGAIVGAGFASGQELLSFFVVFGYWGLVGTTLAGVLFGILGMSVVRTAAREKLVSYDQYMSYIFIPKLAKLFDGIITLSLFLGLAVMLVASGSLFVQLWGYPLWVGFGFTALLVYITLLLGTDGVLWLNTALVPGLILMALAIALISIMQAALPTAQGVQEYNLVGENWFVASLLYVAYNFVLGVVVLVSLGDRVRAGGSGGALLGGLGLGLMATLMSLAILLQGPGILREEIPMLVIAKRLDYLAWGAYSLVLWIALLTTALGNAFGLLRRLEGSVSWPKPIVALLIFLPTLPFIGWSFAKIVGTIYPLLGYLGIALLLGMALRILPWNLIHNLRR